jgi:probable HAF family extracellular repeat protein
MVDLGTLGGSNAAAAYINDDEEIVGFSDITEGARHAFLRTTEGGIVDLGALPGDVVSEAVSVSGLVAGWSKADGGGTHAFTWSVDTGLAQLTQLAPGADTQAFGINSRNIAVGAAKDANGNMQAVCWGADGGEGIKALGTLGGATSSANGINEAGIVVGEASDQSQQLRAFCWVPASGIHQLPSPRGMPSARATSINSANQVVGYAVGKHKRAILWNLGSDLTHRVSARITVLPLLQDTVESEAMAISDTGLVVGCCVTPEGQRRAVLWRPAKRKEVRATMALVGGVFAPTNASTRNRFAKTWLRVALKPFEREKRTPLHFSAESGAYRFNGPTRVRLYQLSFGVEKGFNPGAFVQQYLAFRGGPYYGKVEDTAKGSRQTTVGLNLNVSYGLIFRRNVYVEARYDYFSRFASTDFSGLSLSVGIRLFDIR